MRVRVQARLTFVWGILSVITIISWWLGRTARIGEHFVSSTPVTVGVLAIGFIKARLIMQHFMDVRTAPTWLRRSLDIWLIVFWGAVLGIYLY
jgi:hypothetical protein